MPEVRVKILFSINFVFNRNQKKLRKTENNREGVVGQLFKDSEFWIGNKGDFEKFKGAPLLPQRDHRPERFTSLEIYYLWASKPIRPPYVYYSVAALLANASPLSFFREKPFHAGIPGVYGIFYGHAAFRHGQDASEHPQ